MSLLLELVKRHETIESAYDYPHRRTIRICSMVSSSTSIVAGITAFYFLGMIHPKKRIFRYDLIFLLIVYDFIKAIALLVWPAVCQQTHEAMMRSAPFRNGIGWLTCFSIEGGDFMILCFAVHIALLIVAPDLKDRVKGSRFTLSARQSLSNEGGLYPFRGYIYFLSAIIPTIVSSSAYAKGQGYTAQVNWAYLSKLDATWWFTWICRYCIVVTILIIYVGVYIHVMRQYKEVSSKMDITGGRSDAKLTDMLQDSFWYRLGKFAMMLVFPDVHISAKLHGRGLDSSTDRKNMDRLRKAQAQAEGQAQGQAPGAVSDLSSLGSSSDGGNGTTDAAAANAATAAAVGADIQRMLHREAMDKFQYRRMQIMRQMRVIFVYPLSYMLLWLFPFISQCYTIKYHESNPWNSYWAYTAAAFFQAFNCTIDTIVFIAREKPWTLTACKVDPTQSYNYSWLRRSLAFLPGYHLGNVASVSLDREKGATGCSGAGGPALGHASTAMAPGNDSCGGETLAAPKTQQTNVGGYAGMMNLDDEDISAFAKVDNDGNPLEAHDGGNAIDDDNSDMSIRDFLNSTVPPSARLPGGSVSAAGGDGSSAVAAANATAMGTRTASGSGDATTVFNPNAGLNESAPARGATSRRSSKFSWKTLVNTGNGPSTRKASASSSESTKTN